jgi:hypothetical protein
VTKILNAAKLQLIVNADPEPGSRLHRWGLGWDLQLGFEWATTPQGYMYWPRKAHGHMKWAKKDTKFLRELLGLNEEEDIWL